MDPIIKKTATESELRRMTAEMLGDANDKTIKTFVLLLENFKDADAEAAYHNIGAAQREAFGRSTAFENAFRAFAGLPRLVSFAAGDDETGEDGQHWVYTDQDKIN